MTYFDRGHNILPRINYAVFPHGSRKFKGGGAQEIQPSRNGMLSKLVGMAFGLVENVFNWRSPAPEMVSTTTAASPLLDVSIGASMNTNFVVPDILKDASTW